MKTTINITGQISGNNTLLRAIDTREAEVRDAGFNNYRVIFATKKEAKKQLWEAFKYLRKTIDEPCVGSVGGLNYSKFGILTWDASRAEIQ